MAQGRNAPERYLCWRFEYDEMEATEKLNYAPDSKRSNCGTFVLSKEDHTIGNLPHFFNRFLLITYSLLTFLGNLLRMQLLRDDSVRFAGYRIPHPLVFECHVRVETKDSQTSPVNVFDSALQDLAVEVEAIQKHFELELREIDLRNI